MPLKTNNKDNTGNERQTRRREREKQWLKENGWRSWEALHTALMTGKARLTLENSDMHQVFANRQNFEKQNFD